MAIQSQGDPRKRQRYDALRDAGKTHDQAVAQVEQEFASAIPATEPTDASTVNPTAPQPHKGLGTRLAEIGSTAAQGLTLGAAGNIPALKEHIESFRRDEPGWALGTEVAGGAFNPLGKFLQGLGLGAKAVGLGRTGKVLNRAADLAQPSQTVTRLREAAGKAAASGALQGGTYGLLATEGDLGDRLTGGAYGVGVGGLAGGTLGTAIHPFQRTAANVKARVTGATLPSARRQLADAFEADLPSKPLPTSGGPGDVMVDLGGRNVLGLFHAAAKSSPVAQRMADDFFAGRTQHLTRANEQLVDEVTAEVVGAARAQQVGTANPLIAMRNLGNLAKDRSAKLYEALRATNPELEMTPLLRAVVASPPLRAATAGKAAETFAETRHYADIVRMIQGKPVRGSAGPGPAYTPEGAILPDVKPTWTSLHLARQRLDDMLFGPKGRKLAPNIRADMLELRHGLNAAINEQIPAAAAADAAFAGPMVQRDMIERGMAAAKSGRDAVEEALTNPDIVALGQDAVDHFKLGALSVLRKDIGDRAISSSPAAFWTKNRLETLQMLASPSTGQGIPTRVDILKRQHEPLSAVPKRGAITSGADERAAGLGAGMATAAIQGLGSYARVQLSRFAAGEARRLAPRQAVDIMRILTGQITPDALDELSRLATRSRAGAFGAGAFGATIPPAMEQP